MTRSEIIALAKSLILQGSVDQMWSAAEWDFMFNEAVEYLHDAIIAADSDYFITRGATLTVDGNNRYPLPSDFYSLMWVGTDSDNPLNRATLKLSRDTTFSGYVLSDDYLDLTNWTEAYPTTLLIDYRRSPKEIPTWDGNDDTTKTPIASYTPDSPFNTSRGARTIARLMAVIAKMKDDSNTSADVDLARTEADKLVDRMLSRAFDE